MDAGKKAAVYAVFACGKTCGECGKLNFMSSEKGRKMEFYGNRFSVKRPVFLFFSRRNLPTIHDHSGLKSEFQSIPGRRQKGEDTKAATMSA